MLQRQIFHSVSIAVFLFGCVTASVGSAEESAEERNWKDSSKNLRARPADAVRIKCRWV